MEPKTQLQALLEDRQRLRMTISFCQSLIDTIHSFIRMYDRLVDYHKKYSCCDCMNDLTVTRSKLEIIKGDFGHFQRSFLLRLASTDGNSTSFIDRLLQMEIDLIKTLADVTNDYVKPLTKLYESHFQQRLRREEFNIMVGKKDYVSNTL